jgi:hypothetical protein
MSTFQFSQPSVSTMHSGALSSWPSAGWRLIMQIRWTFKIWVHSQGRSFWDTAGSEGDVSINLNAATQSCWKSGQDAMRLTSEFELYLPVVLLLFWRQATF